MKVCVFVLVAFGLWLGGCAEQCGRDAGGARCPNGLCCSEYGWCGTSEAYCGEGCQSNSGVCRTGTPPAPPGQPDVTDIISPAIFDKMLLHRNELQCPGRGFYTYNAFVTAARFFKGFLTIGDDTIRKRELAAFFAQTSRQTTGGWPNATDGPYTWGYCYVNTTGPLDDSHCVEGRPQWPCVPGQKYYGRGPIQLTYNYNYGPAGQALGLDLLSNPDLVAKDPVVSFETAIWYWMTSRQNIPSSHNVAIGQWQPSYADIAAGRLPGYGVITNIINGENECGCGPVDIGNDRIQFYKRYCDILGIEYGDNLDCYEQRPFAWGLKSSYEM